MLCPFYKAELVVVMEYLKQFNDYLTLVKEQVILNERVLVKRKELNKLFIQEHRKLIWFMDILFFSSFLFNIGDMMLTNMLVMKEMKENPDIRLVEANPIQAQIQNLETLPETKQLSLQNPYFGVIFHFSSIALIIYWYLRARNRAIKQKDLWGLMGIVIVFFIFLGSAFLNGLGFWLGKIWFG